MTASTGAGERLPYHGPCFICGPDNPEGLGLDWYAVDGRVQTRFRFSLAQQGPRDFAHGGAAAAVLDEAMGAAVWMAGHQVLSVNLNVDFRKPVPLDVDVVVEAWMTEVRGRKAYTVGLLRRADSDEPLVDATGIWVATPEFFSGAGSSDPGAAGRNPR
jgi:acyl-coenzyme A thioesterase PaaI-like protein